MTPDIHDLIERLGAGLEGVTPEELRAAVSYDPKSGELRWLADRPSGKNSNRLNARAGDLIRGIDSQGYVTFKFRKQRLRGHRVAYAIHHGRWPSGMLDHINGNRSDNRLSNLREATSAQNGWNRGKQRNNTSGFKGVRMGTHGRWTATIWVEGRPRHLGYFDTPEEASVAYGAAARELHGEFARSA